MRLILFLLALPSVQAAESYSISPKEVALGQTYTVTVNESGCQEPAGALKKSILETPVSGLSLSSPTSGASELTCRKAWKLEVGSAANLGKTNLLLQSENKNVIALLEVDVIPVPPGPTPPGLEKQVDVMWEILPYSDIADSYGRRVASNYFGVRIMLGNNTGYPLQLTAIGFQTKIMKDAAIPPLPNAPYNIPRGTIEREQQVGNRAIVLHSIESAAGLMTGIAGFVRNTGHRSNYNLGLGLANPVTSGFNLVWPDKTVRHLLTMDTRTFRDAALIANNVPSPPILTFISRELVECKKPVSGQCDGNKTVRGVKRVPQSRTAFNPHLIKERLGVLMIAGQPIQYLPRISVTSNRVVETAAPPVANALGKDGDLEQGSKDVRLVITGNGFQTAKIVPDPASKITITTPVIDANGRSMEVKATVDDNALPGEYSLTVSTSEGVSKVPVKVIAAKPKITEVSPASRDQKDTRPFELTLKGNFLTGGAVELVDAAGNKKLTTKAGTVAGELKVSLDLDATEVAKKFQLVATRFGKSSDAVNFELTASEPEVESPAPAFAAKGATAATKVTIKGNHLKGVVAIEPEAGSNLAISNIKWEALTGEAKQGKLSFDVSTKDSTAKVWKLTLKNGNKTATVNFEVK